MAYLGRGSRCPVERETDNLPRRVMRGNARGKGQFDCAGGARVRPHKCAAIVQQEVGRVTGRGHERTSPAEACGTDAEVLRVNERAARVLIQHERGRGRPGRRERRRGQSAAGIANGQFAGSCRHRSDSRPRAGRRRSSRSVNLSANWLVGRHVKKAHRSAGRGLICKCPGSNPRCVKARPVELEHEKPGPGVVAKDLPDQRCASQPG